VKILCREYSGSDTVSQNGDNLSHSRHAIEQFAKRRMHRVLPPPLCQFSATLSDTRRILWRNSRKSVAVPVFAAVHFGDNFATTGIYCAKTFTRDS
jgi:hypothetical protein